MAPYMVMPLVGGASCGESDWMKPRLSMRLVRERQREEGSSGHHLCFTCSQHRDTNEAVKASTWWRLRHQASAAEPGATLHSSHTPAGSTPGEHMHTCANASEVSMETYQTDDG